MQANPFATRFFQPGALEYEYFGRTNSRELIERFWKLQNGKGSILGPHGSGKSTLIATLMREIESLKPTVPIHHVRFSSGTASFSALEKSRRHWKTDSVAILDGYEQLSWLSKVLVRMTAAKRSIRLLITTHKPVQGFETLWTTFVDEDSSRWVIRELLQKNNKAPIAPSLLESPEWHASRAQHGQNLRESLFDMYDWWHKNHSNRTETTSQ